MNALEILRKVSRWGPVLFGVGFIAPLVAQSLDAASVSPPLGLSHIQLGLAVGVSMGAIAKWRGSWV